MGKRRTLPVEMMGLTNQFRRNADAITARIGGSTFTGMQSFILSFIYDQTKEGQDVFQKDVEKEFYISRSTVSGILKLMEKNGTIQRQTVPQDARLRKLVVTPAAAEVVESIRKNIDWMDEQVASCLTPEEQEAMMGYLDKMWKALDQITETVDKAGEREKRCKRRTSPPEQNKEDQSK